MALYDDKDFTYVERPEPDLDVEKAAKILDVRAQARMSVTLDNQPKTTDVDLDGAQRGIVEYCNRMIASLADAIGRRINDFLRGCAEVNIKARSAAIKNLTIKAKEQTGRRINDGFCRKVFVTRLRTHKGDSRGS